MKFILGTRSLSRLEGVHPALVLVVKRAIELTPIDFTVTCGLRTIEEQRALFASGASKTMKSRHLTGHAVDLAALEGGKVTWEWKHYETLATATKAAAKELSILIEWGGDWKSFKDGPHFQLPWKEYP